MARRYPKELEPWMREKFRTLTARQIAPMVKKEWGFSMTPVQVHSYTQNHRIHYGRKGKKNPEARITTPEMDAFIKAHIKGTGPVKMAGIVNRKFGTNFTKEQMKAYYSRNKLNSGLTGYFPKGHIPYNRGKVWDEYLTSEQQAASRKTHFKKGHIPHNGGAPVGELRIRHETKRKGSKPYYWEKTAQPNIWRMKHIVEWEKAHGPVPKGYVVGFADGDTLNWDIGNLILSTRAQHLIKNRFGIHGHDQESARAANLLADLKSASNRARMRTKKRRKH